MDKLNRFFFPLEEDEKLNVHDALWFYGILGGAILTTAFVAVVTW